MEKRYQVFVSSTYADLKSERQKVIQTLMEMDCIPSGMELFPAADEEQWEFIKKVIDDCDYYLLIIGGRYGSTTQEGISYTEKEYDYAISKDIKVIALLHSSPEEIPAGKSEKDPNLQERLNQFRDKVSKNRLVKYWKSAEELPGLVALSLSKTIKTYPAVGWIRADKASSEELLHDINLVRKENESLKQALSQYVGTIKTEVPDLASIDAKYTITGNYYHDAYHQRSTWSIELSWREIFSLIAPYLLKFPNEEYVEVVLKNSIFDKTNLHGSSIVWKDQIFQTVKVQLMAMKLVTVKYSQTIKGGMALFWSLTPQGEALMFETRTIKSNIAQPRT